MYRNVFKNRNDTNVCSHFWAKGEFGAWIGDDEKKEWCESYCQPGVIPGHEFIGNAIHVGPKAAEKFDIKEGDQIVWK